MRNVRVIFTGLMLAVASTAINFEAALGQALDMTGVWRMTVESPNGVTNPTLTLTQEGTRLTGRYSSETLGDANVTGTVEGRHVIVNFSAVIPQLGEAPLAYSGDVDESGVWSGGLEADVQGQPFPLGPFTATKS